jgi:DinB superfamily
VRSMLIVLTMLLWDGLAHASEPGEGKALAAPLQLLNQFNQQNLIAAGKTMAPEKFDYRPAPAPVRSFGEILAHVADANYLFCSAAAGKPDPIHGDLKLPVEAVPQDALERRLHGKPEIVEALEQSFQFCSGVFGELTDAGLATSIEGNFGTRATGVDPPTALGVPGRR